MARLEILDGPNSGASFTVGDEVILGRSFFGRQRDNFIHLADSRISRRHARITRIGWLFLLEDLGSINGTILRGEIITPRMPRDLYDGDEIWLSSYHFLFHLDKETLTAQPERKLRVEDSNSIEVAMAGETQAMNLELGPFAVVVLDDNAMQSEVSVVLDAGTVIPQKSVGAAPTDQAMRHVLKRLEAVCEVSIALGVVTDEHKLMQRILDFIFDLFPVVERAFLLMQDQPDGTLVPKAIKQREFPLDTDSPAANPLNAVPEKLALSRSIADEVIRNKRSVLSFDTLTDKRFKAKDSILNLPIRSVMCAPLLVNNEVLGIIQADTGAQPHAFTAEDLQVFTGITAQAAIAVKNSQLYKAIAIETAQRTSLQRYFSPHLVEMIMSGDLSDELGGSLYRGTILFADIIGFTSMSESMSPVEIVTRLNRYFTSMQHIIYDNNGNVDKFRGDDVMAFWGVPKRNPADECDAVRTGIQMQAKLWASNLSLEREGQEPLHMGIGLNTGEFVAGNIGSQDKIEFTLIGDTVNLAARIVKLAASYQVLVAADTWRPIKHLVSAIELPPTMVKGKSQPVPVYSIRAVAYRTRNAYAMALPCHVLDSNGERIGRGILTESTSFSTTMRLFFSTETDLDLGQQLTLQPAMEEYHQTWTFSVRVESRAKAAYDGDTAYTKTILTVLQGDEFINFMRPGSCLVTKRSWSDFSRG